MSLSSLINSFKRLTVFAKPTLELSATLTAGSSGLLKGLSLPSLIPVRNVGKQNPVKYKTIPRICYKRVVIWPEDMKYTTKPLPIRKLGGRDPVTGRVAVDKIGGGHKQKFRWVMHKREVPKGSEPFVEKVEAVRYDPLRTGDIALVAGGDQKRWIIATVNMKPGDLITTHSEIPKNPVKAKEGDRWPLGALPMGTLVHSVEMFSGRGGYFARAAGTCCILLRKINNRVIIQLPSKRQASLSEECLATVGQVSNPKHNEEHIGSPIRARWLGIRPGSGLWHRKDGYCGRKIRPIKPLRVYDVPKKEKKQVFNLTAP